MIVGYIVQNNMTLKKTTPSVNVSSAANARNLKSDKAFGSSALAYAKK